MLTCKGKSESFTNKIAKYVKRSEFVAIILFVVCLLLKKPTINRALYLNDSVQVSLSDEAQVLVLGNKYRDKVPSNAKIETYGDLYRALALVLHPDRLSASELDRLSASELEAIKEDVRTLTNLKELVSPKKPLQKTFVGTGPAKQRPEASTTNTAFIFAAAPADMSGALRPGPKQYQEPVFDEPSQAPAQKQRMADPSEKRSFDSTATQVKQLFKNKNATLDEFEEAKRLLEPAIKDFKKLYTNDISLAEETMKQLNEKISALKALRSPDPALRPATPSESAQAHGDRPSGRPRAPRQTR